MRQNWRGLIALLPYTVKLAVLDISFDYKIIKTMNIVKINQVL